MTAPEAAETALTPTTAASDVRALVDAVSHVLRLQAELERFQAHETEKVLDGVARTLTHLGEILSEVPPMQDAPDALAQLLDALLQDLTLPAPRAPSPRLGDAATQAQLDQLQAQIASIRGSDPEETLEQLFRALVRIAATSMAISVQNQLSQREIQLRAVEAAESGVETVTRALTARLAATVLATKEGS